MHVSFSKPYLKSTTKHYIEVSNSSSISAIRIDGASAAQGDNKCITINMNAPQKVTSQAQLKGS